MEKAEFMQLVSQYWDRVQDLQDCTNFYDHEKQFDELWTQMGQDVLEKSINQPVDNYRKKNCGHEIRSSRSE